MANTTHLELPLLAAAQSQKHVTHNEAVLRLDAVVQLAVKDRDLTAPPGSPADGDRYIVAAGATGAWASWDLNVAWYHDGVWTKLSPREGWRVWVEDENLVLVWDGSAWGPTGKPLERGFWTDQGSGANIWRFRDRVFVGDGVDSSGNWTAAANESWLKTAYAYWPERSAQLFVAATKGNMAIVGASRTSDMDPAFPASAIGVSGFAVNDSTGLAAWGGYFDIVRQPGAAITYGIELAIKDKGSNVVHTPYFHSGGTVGIWFAGGGDGSVGGAPAVPSTAAIEIGDNDHTWNTGIVFHATGLTGTDGVTGTGTAIALARGHALTWFTPAGSSGASIYSEVDNNDQRVSLNFRDSTVRFMGLSGIMGQFENGAGAGVSPANYPRLISFAAGTTKAEIRAGGETNVDLWLSAKGLGLVRMSPDGVSTRFAVNSTGIGFFAATPAAKQTVSGSRGGNAALADLLAKLATYGLITNGTTA